jgi:hypothetical protein
MNYNYTLPSLQVKLPEAEFTPEYKITPYFLLKGTNDNGDDVYI